MRLTLEILFIAIRVAELVASGRHYGLRTREVEVAEVIKVFNMFVVKRFRRCDVDLKRIPESPELSCVIK